MKTCNFKSSKRLGERKEDDFRRLCEAHGVSCVKNTEESKLSLYDFDCKMDDEAFTVEVKCDALAKKYGNIALEYFNTRLGRPSGIAVTTSDLWVHFDKEDSFLLFNTEKLKQMQLSQAPEPWFHEVHGGDNNSLMDLYRVEEMEKLDFCSRVNLDCK